MRYRRPWTMGFAIVLALACTDTLFAQSADQPVTSYAPVTPTETFDAVMARRRHRLLEGCRRCAAMQQADGAPRLVVVEAVEVVARGDARLAARAGVEVHLEGVLLAGTGPARREEVAVVARLSVSEIGRVAAGEALDRGQVALLTQEAVDRRLLDGVDRGEDHGSPTSTRSPLTRTG